VYRGLGDEQCHGARCPAPRGKRPARTDGRDRRSQARRRVVARHGRRGFIGSSLMDRLLQRGNEVVAYDNLSTGMNEFLA
jgi:hypothetical protein